MFEFSVEFRNGNWTVVKWEDDIEVSTFTFENRIEADEFAQTQKWMCG